MEEEVKKLTGLFESLLIEPGEQLLNQLLEEANDPQVQPEDFTKKLDKLSELSRRLQD